MFTILFTIYGSYKYQRLKFPLMSLFLSPLLGVGFPLFYKSSTNVVVRWGGEEPYSPMIRSQLFTEPLLLGSDLRKCFSIWLLTLTNSGETGGIEVTRVRDFLSPTWKQEVVGVAFFSFLKVI